MRLYTVYTLFGFIFLHVPVNRTSTEMCYRIIYFTLKQMGRDFYLRRLILILMACLVLICFNMKPSRQLHETSTPVVDIQHCNSFSMPKKDGDGMNFTFLVTWYNLNPFLEARPEALHLNFKSCQYNNCEMSLCKKSAEHSDAVIFDGRRVPENYEFKRKKGQIWIFAEDETPFTFDLDGGYWKMKYWRHAFNWTMTYDRYSTDIYLPYGEIRPKARPDTRDFLQIAKSKSRDALIITSHCKTKSRRLEYVELLQKYIDVDILGSCGRKWACGEQYIHNDCFDILNSTYKFYLAFENALCRGYRTEKFFENFNYDIIIVSRSGISADDNVEPNNIYISASDFESVDQLGKYLKYLANDVNAYARLLERKSQYYSPGFHVTYQKALCQVCEKMNNLDKHSRQIHDTVFDVQGVNPCKYFSNEN